MVPAGQRLSQGACGMLPVLRREEEEEVSSKISLHGPTFSGRYNLFGLDEGGFTLQGGLTVPELRVLHRKIGTVLAREDRRKAKAKAKKGATK